MVISLLLLIHHGLHPPQQGIVGDVDDSNVLAIKAAEVVREQRQSHSHTITMDATTPPTSQSPLSHSKPASPDLVNGRLSSSPLPSNHDNRSLGDEGVVSDIQSPEADVSRLNDRSQPDTSHSGQGQPQLEGQSEVKPQLEGQSEVKPQTQSQEDSGEFSLASVSQGVEHRLRKVSVTPHVEGRGQPSPSECEEGQGGPTPQGTPPATPPATPPTPLARHQVMSVDEDQFSRVSGDIFSLPCIMHACMLLVGFWCLRWLVCLLPLFVGTECVCVCVCVRSGLSMGAVGVGVGMGGGRRGEGKREVEGRGRCCVGVGGGGCVWCYVFSFFAFLFML